MPEALRGKNKIKFSKRRCFKMKNKSMKGKIVLILAAAIAMGIAGGCGNKDKAGDTTKITWHLRGVKQDSSYDRVWDEVDKLLKERYNLDLDIILTDGGNYNQKIQMLNATCEPYDLVFTSNWTNNFYVNIKNGSLFDITELLPEYAPTVNEQMSDAERTVATVDGKLYGVPNWQVQARATAIAFPKDKLEKTGFTLDEINTIEDLGKYLEAIVALEPNSNKADMFFDRLITYYDMYSVLQEKIPGVCRISAEGKPVVLNQYETEEFREYAKTMYDWAQRGIKEKHLDSTDYSVKELQQSPFLLYSTYKPGLQESESLKKGYEIIGKQFSNSVVTPESILATVTGVGAYSEHPEDAVRMIEIMRTDKEIYNMLAWGLEGENYEKISDTQIKPKENMTYSMSDWAMGSVLNSYVTDQQAPDLAEQLKVYNDTGIVSQLMGFSVNTDNIVSQVGNCETVIKEQLDLIDKGNVEDPDAAVDKLIESLKVAGADKIVSEIQKQIDEWWATK